MYSSDENIVNFHTRVKYVSLLPMRSKNAMQTNGQKTPKPPLPNGGSEPYLIHQSIGWPHLPLQTAAWSLYMFLHSYVTKSPLEMGCPMSAPKTAPSSIWTGCYPSLGPPESPSEMASPPPQPSDRRMDRQTKPIMCPVKIGCLRSMWYSDMA